MRSRRLPAPPRPVRLVPARHSRAGTRTDGDARPRRDLGARLRRHLGQDQALAIAGLVLTVGLGAALVAPVAAHADAEGWHRPAREVRSADGTPRKPAVPTEVIEGRSGDLFGDPIRSSDWELLAAFDLSAARVEKSEPVALWGERVLARTAWIAWTAPADGTVAILTSASEPWDSGVNVYTGATLKSLTRIATSDRQDYPLGGLAGSGSSSQRGHVLSLRVRAGVTYRIQVGTSATPAEASEAFGPADAGLVIRPSNYVVPNDDLAHATVLRPGADGTARDTVPLIGATLENWEHQRFGATVVDRSVWYAFTAPADGGIRVDACSRLGTLVEVYTESPDSRLAFVGGGKNGAECGGGTTGARFGMPVERGTRYLVRVSEPQSTVADAARVTLSALFTEPWIGALSSTKGATKGGTKLTIRGQAFTSGGTPVVMFGSTPATVVGSDGDGEITVRVPKAAKAGSVEVTVTSGGVRSNAVRYRYL